MRGMGFGPALNIGPGSKIFNGGSLSLLSDYDNRQMLSMILQDKDGTLVVIDGGWDIDAAHLTEVLRSKGGHVSGWFITHPHSDHVGALVQILENPDSQITIDNVYYSLADPAWYEKVEPSRNSMVSRLISALATLPAEKLHTVEILCLTRIAKCTCRKCEQQVSLLHDQKDFASCSRSALFFHYWLLPSSSQYLDYV